jgi:hypothetical protein
MWGRVCQPERGKHPDFRLDDPDVIRRILALATSRRSYHGKCKFQPQVLVLPVIPVLSARDTIPIGAVHRESVVPAVDRSLIFQRRWEVKDGPVI